MTQQQASHAINRRRTIDSYALENSDQIDEEFKRVFAPEIKHFKDEYARGHGPGAAERIADKL